MVEIFHDRDIVEANENLLDKEVSLLEKGLQKNVVAENTVFPEELKMMIDKHQKNIDIMEKLI